MRGLSVFKEKFADYSGNYVVIGGMACLIIFEDVGESFRATQDVDIVVLMEENNHDFAAAFWEFIKDGGYQQIAQGSLAQRGRSFFVTFGADYRACKSF